tara:strand:+ start:692 stop:1204 length:513 start_codon:yes stop_codon:yes gene_type:complete
MATVETLVVAARGTSTTPSRSPYFVEASIDIAAAVTAKGTALVADDIIQAITVPANTMILTAGFEVTTSVDAAADGNTVNLGVTGVDVTRFVAAFDIDDDSAALSSGVGYATQADGAAPIIIGATADTIDLELQATTTAPTEGVIRVFAVLMDIDALGGSAAEVDRDQLA